MFVVPFNTSLVYILEYNKRRDFLFGWNSGAASGSFAKSSSAIGGGTGNGLQPWHSADESQIYEFLEDFAWDMEDVTVIDASTTEEDTQDEDTSENALEESAVSSQDSSRAFTFDEQNTTSVQLQNASPEKLGITSPEKSNEDSEDLKLPVNEDTWEGCTNQKLCDKEHQFLCTPKILEAIQHPIFVMKRTPFKIHMFNQHLWDFLLQLGNGNVCAGQSLLATFLNKHTAGEFPVPFEFTDTIVTAAQVSMRVKIRGTTLANGKELVCTIQDVRRTEQKKPDKVRLRAYTKFEAYSDTNEEMNLQNALLDEAEGYAWEQKQQHYFISNPRGLEPGGSILESAHCKPAAGSMISNLQQAWTHHSQKRKLEPDESIERSPTQKLTPWLYSV